MDATLKASLHAALADLVAKYRAAILEVKPNYSIDGQSVSRADYLRQLREEIQEHQNLMAQLDPFEWRSVSL